MSRISEQSGIDVGSRRDGREAGHGFTGWDEEMTGCGCTGDDVSETDEPESPRGPGT